MPSLIRTQPFYPNSFYFVYNSGNNRERLFYALRNYKYFLEKYDEYLSDSIDTYAYCLIPNHFQLLIKTPSKVDKISNQFRKFFITYSKTINFQENRIGSLFIKPFRRKPITNINYLQKVIFYIHNKPVQNGICNNLEDYKWSSYKTILSDLITRLKREAVIELFGSKGKFIEFHREMQNYDNKELELLEENSK